MVAPSKFAHVVYDTHRYREMIDWYGAVFEARVAHGDDRLTFMTYDDEHHRFAFRNLGPGTDGAMDKQRNTVGVNHLAYTWNGVGELLDTYKRLKAAGVTPARPIRHGMTLSMYYVDPDGNVLEFQADLMSAEAANRFMDTEAFARNPIGEPFDPDELLARYEAGQAIDDLIFRADQPESQGQAFARPAQAAE